LRVWWVVILAIVMVLVVALGLAMLPDIRRYLRMRSM
jgi:purine-cytosine permease-like protein